MKHAYDVSAKRLRFMDPAIEADYRATISRNTHKDTRIALLFSPIIYLGYSLFDWLLLGSDSSDIIWIRLLTVIIQLPFLFSALLKPEKAISHTLLLATTLAYGITMSIGITYYDQDYTLYFVTGLVMINTYCTLLYFPRVWDSAITMLISSSICLVTVYLQFDDPSVRIISIHVLLTMGLFILWAAHRLEHGRRLNFIQQLQVIEGNKKLAQSEKERADWLEHSAHFMRHELKNSLRGISSSLEMYKRFNKDQQNDKYLLRAEQSITLCNRLLKNAGNATALESQLRNEVSEVLELNALVIEYVNTLPELPNDLHINLSNTDTSIHIEANPERLYEALDYILNNAYDFATPGTDIRVSLKSDQHHALVTIENAGDPLPEKRDDIFSAFISKRSGDRYSQENLGIGLYLTKAIMTFYGGKISAEDPSPSSGARFILTLPQLS